MEDASDPYHIRTVEKPQQALHLGLSEYAPGRLIVINKETYRSEGVAASMLPTDIDRALPLFQRRQFYVFCPNCSYVQMPRGEGDTSVEESELCPLCREGTLLSSRMITPEVFYPEDGHAISPTDRDQEYTYATSAQFPVPIGNEDLGGSEPLGLNARLYRAFNQPLVIVNRGDDETDEGFWVCDHCGTSSVARDSDPPSAGHRRPYYIQRRRDQPSPGRCQGQFQRGFLGHRFLSDLMLLRLTLKEPFGQDTADAVLRCALEDALRTFSEGLLLAASRHLDIDAAELSAGFRLLPKAEKEYLRADVYLFDTLSGGAGYSEQAGREIDAVLKTLEHVLGHCPAACDTSAKVVSGITQIGIFTRSWTVAWDWPCSIIFATTESRRWTTLGLMLNDSNRYVTCSFSTGMRRLQMFITNVFRFPSLSLGRDATLQSAVIWVFSQTNPRNSTTLSMGFAAYPGRMSVSLTTIGLHATFPRLTPRFETLLGGSEMHPLYILHPPDELPASPTHWSWSSLAQWRACPRRWWLLHARYGFALNGRYPIRLGSDALRGQIVHDALEAFHTAPQPFNAYRYMRRRLGEKLRELEQSNPRVNSGKLAASISLDRCCADLYDQVRRLPAPKNRTANSESRCEPPSSNTAPSEAQELPIEINDPPLAGRIDLVMNGEIIDYKTGDPSQEHVEQLRFYAFLWWLRYGKFSIGLELRYASVSVSIPLPTHQELLGIEESIRSEIAAITRDLANAGSPPAARPSEPTCRYCPVRQLCNEYWESHLTRRVRCLPPSMAEGQAVFIDVQLAPNVFSGCDG